MRHIFAAAAIVAGLCVVSSANASTQIDASSTGWITDQGYADNSLGGGVTNNYAGWETNQYNDWFQFNLPSSPISNASISIWNSEYSSTLDPNAVYSLHKAGSFSFDGLVNGSASLGSVTLGVADTGVGEYITIDLNSLGVSLLNANLGGSFVFGGTISTSYPDPGSTDDQIDAWGYTGGYPVAYLTVNAVPEPATWAMMLLGFAGIGFAGYRTSRKAVSIAA